MKQATILAVMIGSLGLGTGVRPAAGYPVTFEFAGEITYVVDDDGLLGGAVTVGSPFSGLYTFESTTPDSLPDRTDIAVYDDAVTSVLGQLAGIQFFGPLDSTDYIRIKEFPTIQSDFFQVFAVVDLVEVPLSFSLTLIDDDGTGLEGDSLPLSPPDLTLFDSRVFLISDASEVIPITLRGQITSLVPEPSTLVLLVLATAAVWQRPSSRRENHARGRRGMRRAHVLALSLAFATVAELGVVTPVRATACNENNCPPAGCDVTGQDCNDNGVDDAVDIVNQFSEDCNRNRMPDECEVPQCAPIDVVFLFDTSGSMNPPGSNIAELCLDVDEAIAQLNTEGLCVRSEIREIFEGGEIPCPCCDDDPVNVAYPTTTEGLPEVLGDGCLYPEEDWGPATAIVAGEKDWTPGPRIIVPISDEGPRCGYRLDGEDQAVIDHAIPIMWCNRVTVVPVTLTREVDLKALAQALADGGAPQGQVLNIESYDLADELAAVIRSVCPEDCNQNDIIDACDISEGTSLDCDEDGVPDECHLAGYLDCQDPPNGNGIPDPCDLNCGPVMGDCAHWPGCGQSTDCDNNCVPDDCEWDFVDCHQEGQPGYGTLDLCDIAEGTSPDCYSYQTNCCVARCEGGCDDQGVQTCVCELSSIPGLLDDPSSCCSTQWTQQCVYAAQFSCSLTCPDVGSNGVPDECEKSPDCNCNFAPDAQDLASGTSPDCNGNCIPDECDIADGTSEDCNTNGIPDECDLGEGASCDMNEDGVPDECFACCLPSGEDFTCENRTPTYCETGLGHTAERGVCEPFYDLCAPEACCIVEETTVVCKWQTRLACDRDGGYSVSYAGQCGAGTCDVGACCTTLCVDGITRAYCDNHGGIYRGGAVCSDDPCAVPEPWERPEAPIPYPKWDPQFCPEPFVCVQDWCSDNGVCMCEDDAHCLGEVETSCIDGFCYVNVHKNRYLSFIPGNLGKLTALRVTLTHSEKFNDPDVIGRQWWVGEPEGFSENSGTRKPPSTADWPTFWAAQLTCEQHFVDWPTVLGCGAPLYVYGPQIIPHATYQVQALGPHCSPDDRRNLSAPLTIATGLWGDISMGQDEITLLWDPPDWFTPTLLVDLMAVIDKFRNSPNAPIKARCDLSPPCGVGGDQQTPNQLINITDATVILEAVRQNSPENPFVYYPFDEPPECE